jgi:hypothetical protein
LFGKSVDEEAVGVASSVSAITPKSTALGEFVVDL